jgi:DNA-directed RNA polymerase subunit alpha
MQLHPFIEGVDHEFSTISGVVEDVTEIILNLKQVRFKRQIEDIDNEAVTISVSGKDQLTAGDFQKFISGFQVLNPELVICNLDPKIKLNFDLTIEKVEDMFLLRRTTERCNWNYFYRFYFTPVKNVKISVLSKNRL